MSRTEFTEIHRVVEGLFLTEWEEWEEWEECRREWERRHISFPRGIDPVFAKRLRPTQQVAIAMGRRG